MHRSDSVCPVGLFVPPMLRSDCQRILMLATQVFKCRCSDRTSSESLHWRLPYTGDFGQVVTCRCSDRTSSESSRWRLPYVPILLPQSGFQRIITLGLRSTNVVKSTITRMFVGLRMFLHIWWPTPRSAVPYLQSSARFVDRSEREKDSFTSPTLLFTGHSNR
jgi:hypothetical protein